LPQNGLWKRAKGYGRIKRSHEDVAQEERQGKPQNPRKRFPRIEREIRTHNNLLERSEKTPEV
jgi:hypothetical protein